MELRATEWALSTAGAVERSGRASRAWRPSRRAFLAATVAMDAAAVTASVFLAFLVRFEGTLPQPNWAAAQHLLLPGTAALLACYYLAGLYHRRTVSSHAEIASMVVRGNVLWLCASFAIAYVERQASSAYPTAVIFLAAAFNAALSYGAHLALEKLRTRHLVRSRLGRRALLIGATPEGRKLLRAARSAGASFEYAFVAALDDRRRADGGEWDLGRLLREERVEVVILANPALETRELLHCLVQCAGLDVRFKLVPTLEEIVRRSGSVKLVAGVPLVDLFDDEVPTMRDVGRRAFDLAGACLGLLLSLPLWPLVALAVKLSSRGPVWYGQERVGLHGRSFQLLKFRTMRADAEAGTGPVLATLRDARVTRVGRFLRLTRLDELPQLLNVLKGEMSLVGPRPERPWFVSQFLRSVPAYARRYSIRPGITGLAQVRGRYETTARNKVRYDVLYLEKRSFALDLAILARTVPIVLGARGAR